MEDELVFVSLGTNIGNNREDILKGSLGELGKVLSGLRCSRFFETSPRYVVDQPYFLNAVARGLTVLSPEDFLSRVHEIETHFGRNRALERRKGPRPLDIDILLYGNRTVVTHDLSIPHPLMKERKFVLLPLLELDPEITDPETGERYSAYLEKLAVQGIYYSSLNEYTATFKTELMNGNGYGGSAIGE